MLGRSHIEEQRDRDEGDIRGDRMREREKRERERPSVGETKRSGWNRGGGWLARVKGDEETGL